MKTPRSQEVLPVLEARVQGPPPPRPGGAAEGRRDLERMLLDCLRELSQVERRLLRNESQLRQITDALPVLVAYVEPAETYRFVNAAYQRWFGLPGSQVLGRTMREVLGEAAYALVRPHVRQALEGQPVSFEAWVPYARGGERFVQASYVPDVSPKGEVLGFIVLVSDQSERHRLELLREASAARVERLGRLTSAIADAITSEEVVEALVDQTAAAIDASSSALWLVEPDGRRATLMRSVGYTDSARAHLTSLDLQQPGRLPVVDCLRGGQPLWLDSQGELFERYPHLQDIATPGKAYRVACLPLIVQEQTLGALAFTSQSEPTLDAEQRAFLLLVSRHAGQALERLRLLRHAEAAAAREALLSRASRAFSEAEHDPREVLQVVTSLVAESLVDTSAIALRSENGALLEVAGLSHRDPEGLAALKGVIATSVFKVGEGLLGQVAESGQSIFINHIDLTELTQGLTPSQRGWLESYPPSSLCVVAMRARGRALGLLICVRQAPKGPFLPAEQALLQELADRAALAIEAAFLKRDNAQARLRAELLYGLAAAVNGAERLDQVFDIAFDGIAQALGARQSAIVTYDTSGVQRVAAWRGMTPRHQELAMLYAPWPRDAKSPSPVFISEVAAEPSLEPHWALFEREQVQSVAFIPLVATGRLLGAFVVYDDRPRAHGPSELGVGQAIADHVAAAVARFDAIGRLQDTLRSNELFAGVLAHDLRNPLGAILTSAQLVLRRQEGQSERTRRPLNRIISSGERMTRMVEQLLDFTRARAGGGFQLSPRPMHLGELCHQVIDELAVANPEWCVRLEEAGDLFGVWDPDRLGQVVSNLVANAGQHGSIEAGVHVRLDGSDAELVMIEVRNEGVIPQPVRHSLFDPFRRVGQRPAKARGLGLGLFITKELVATHGGEVAVSSSEAEGTIFVVGLPRNASGSK